MIDVVIIGHNEGEHIVDMFTSIPGSFNIVYVADRCSDETIWNLCSCARTNRELCDSKSKPIIINANDDYKGRRTSEMRNLGARYTRPNSDILFLDGDRYPTRGGLLKLNGWHKDIALLLVEEDGREEITDYQRSCYGRVYNGFYSCGIFIKRHAIEKIMRFQNGEIFREDMQSEWGIEDTYLGDACYHLNLSADIYRHCRLRGRFEKMRLDSLDTLEKRLIERNKLNVRWD